MSGAHVEKALRREHQVTTREEEESKRLKEEMMKDRQGNYFRGLRLWVQVKT